MLAGGLWAAGDTDYKAIVPGGGFIAFGDFRLDRVEGRLWHGDVERPLRAKSFALLRYLAEHPGRLVTRDELLHTVWPGVAVSSGVVRISIGEVRGALEDDALAPRFLETVGRQGYRFLSGSAAEAVRGAFVGRDGDLARLHRSLERCRDHRRQVLFVAGEPGIGKTTLVERFADEVRGGKLGRVAQGQCVELHGPSEAYLPVLELLGRLCREEASDAVQVLERWAPSWLLQMPGIADARAMEPLRRRVPSPTRERMLRELTDAFDVLARDTPLVVVLEDLHWSDASTVDLLAYVAERNTPARLLVIGTYRPVELVVRAHPLHATARQLIARGRAAEAALELLTEDDVRAYLAQRFAGQPMDPRLPEFVHRQTDGNPLFLVSVVDHLLDRGSLTREQGTWRLASAQDAAVPQSLRELVGQQLDALGPVERATLAAASVMGVEFDTLAVAAAAELPVAMVERTCAALAERGQLVCTTGTTAWPDGSLGGTYEFLHALYQHVLYERLAPAERSRLHRAIGSRLEAAHAGDPGAIAAVLASHFERGGDWARAVAHHRAAVAGAKARLADREVVTHCEAVLGLLDRLSDSAERQELEITCSIDLGLSLLTVRGAGTPEIEPIFARARDRAVELGLPQFEIIGRGGVYTLRALDGDQRCALELAGDLGAMAERFPIPLFTLIGHTALACAHYNVGHLLLARDQFERARTMWQPELPRLQLDQKVLCLGIGTLVLQQLGDTTAAEAWSAEGVAYASALSDPLNVAHAWTLMAHYRMWADDRAGAIAWADRAIAVALEHGFPVHEGEAKMVKGWALGDLALQREGFARRAATGHHVGAPMYRLGLARTCLDQGSVP